MSALLSRGHEFDRQFPPAGRPGTAAQRATIPFPPAAYTRIETSDAARHEECIAGWCNSFDYVDRKPIPGQITQLWLWPLQIIHERLEQRVAYRGTAWDGAQIFASFVSAPESTLLNGRKADENTLVAFPWHMVSHAFMPGPYECISVVVQQDALVQHAAKVLRRPVSRELLCRSFSLHDPGAVGEFRRCAASILAKVADDPDWLRDDTLTSPMRQELLDMLTGMVVKAIRLADPLPPPTTRSYIVDKAIQEMGAHLSDDFSMSDIAKAIRVCPRTLRYSFEDTIGVSPTQYLLAMRLGRARRDLVKTRSLGQIRCIAEKHGFTHMGRFAKFYHETFGERPSETCKRGPHRESASL